MKEFIKSKKTWVSIGLVSVVGIIGFFFSSGSGNKGGPGAGFSMRVVVETARKENIEETIPQVGTLAANESVEIKSEIEGKVESVNFIEGQRVNKGRVLFFINKVKLSAHADQAEANFRLSQSNMKRSKTLLKKRTISKQEYEQALSKYKSDKANLELTRQELKDATIRAPFNGIIGARFVSPGQVVTKGTLLSTLIDENPIKVEFNVPERYAGRVKPGLSVDLTVASYPEEIFQGSIYFVSPFVDTLTRTMLAKARVPNKKNRLHPGMFANVELRLGTIQNAVTVPEASVMKKGDRIQIYVATSKKVADLRNVKVGLRFKDKVQILEGIQAGELVVTEGVQKIRPGVPLSFDTQNRPEEKKSAEATDQPSPDKKSAD